MNNVIIRTKSKTKSININYDNIIENIDDLINQMDSLKEEAIYMMRSAVNVDKVFQKDFHALKIVIDLLNQIKEVIPNDK